MTREEIRQELLDELNAAPGKSGLYDPNFRYALDEVLVFDSLWVSIHAWAKAADDEKLLNFGEILWINFRVLEHEGQDEETRNPRYRQSDDARAADYWIAEGFLKRDGCCEIQMDHHFCGMTDYLNVAKAIANFFAWAGEEFGFEECSEPVNPKGDHHEP